MYTIYNIIYNKLVIFIYTNNILNTKYRIYYLITYLTNTM